MSVCAPREREAECAPRARTCMTCTRAEVCSMSCLQTEVEGGATRCILLEVGVMLTVCHVFGRGDMQQTQRGGRVRRLRAPAGPVRGRASPGPSAHGSGRGSHARSPLHGGPGAHVWVHTDTSLKKSADTRLFCYSLLDSTYTPTRHTHTDGRRMTTSHSAPPAPRVRLKVMT